MKLIIEITKDDWKDMLDEGKLVGSFLSAMREAPPRVKQKIRDALDDAPVCKVVQFPSKRVTKKK